MKHPICIAKACLLVVLLSSCAGLTLRVENIESMPEEIGPTYRLIYFVGTERYDVRRAVILDLEGDDYEFRPAVQDFEYEILQNIPLPEAVFETEIFFRYQGVKGYNKSAIMSPEGTIVGFEFRPLYHKEFMGIEDLLNMSYNLDKGSGLISVNISLRASLKRLVY